MKKLFVILIVVLIASLLIAPFFVGGVAENKFNEIIAQTESYNVSVSSRYARSWFSSDAETTMRAGSSLLKNVPAQLQNGLAFVTGIVVRTTHAINHGPFSFSDLGGHHSPIQPVIAAIHNTSTIILPHELSNDSITLHTYATINMNGSYDSYLDIPAASHSITADVPVTIQYDTLSASTHLSPDLKKTDYTLSIPSFFLRSDNGALAADRLSLSGSSQKGIFDLLFGSNHCEMSQLTIENPSDSSTLQLSGFSFDMVSFEQNSSVALTTTTRLNSLLLDDVAYGPGAFTFAYRNVDAESLYKLQNIFTMFKNAQWDEQHVMANSFMLYSQIMALLPQLLSKSPEVEIRDFSFVTPDGDFSGNVMIAVQGITKDMVLTTAEIINALDATATLSLPVAFVDTMQAGSESSPFMPFVALLEKKGDAYVLNARFSRGVLTVNDTIIPLPFGNLR